MPEKLIEFLKNLDYESAGELWEYLDSDVCAVDDMIEVICESHQGLRG